MRSVTIPSTLVALCWQRFRGLLEPNDLARIRLPAEATAIQAAELHLGVALPPELRALYLLADGFEVDGFLLRDQYRILPIAEMAALSRARVGRFVVTDALAGEGEAPKKVVRLVFAQAKEDDPDVDDVSLRLRKRGATVEVSFREGGIHDFAEVADTGQPLATWLEECLEYY